MECSAGAAATETPRVGIDDDFFELGGNSLLATQVAARLGHALDTTVPVRALFEVARTAGYDCDYQALRPADLLSAQGVWLVSSITLAARVHTLDGTALAPAPLAADIAALVDTAILSDR